MIVVTGENLTLHKNLGGGLEPISPIASTATAYNSDAPEVNFTKRGCEGIVVLLFLEFLLVSAQRPSEKRRSQNFRFKKWTF